MQWTDEEQACLDKAIRLDESLEMWHTCQWGDTHYVLNVPAAYVAVTPGYFFTHSKACAAAVEDFVRNNAKPWDDKTEFAFRAIHRRWLDSTQLFGGDLVRTNELRLDQIEKARRVNNGD